MSTKIHRSNAERLGRWLGEIWRVYARCERQASSWLVVQGVPAGGAAALLWAIKLGVLAILFYVVFWLALLIVSLLMAVLLSDTASTQDEDDFLSRKVEEQDHRNSLFYHPASYNDDPDPRFEDD